MVKGGVPTAAVTSDQDSSPRADPAPLVDAAAGASAAANATTVPWRLGNQPPLTGIRAPGMALVLIFHSNFHTFPGSWVALGLFFVLSGFLITSMLAGEQQRTGGISLKNFYSRRAFRLLPPLFLIVAVLAIYASVVNVFSAANDLWTNVAGGIFYFADYQAAFHHEPTIAYFSQTWSLAVEEQFYVVWAVLLFVALRYGSRRIAYGIAIVGVLASIADRLYIVLSAPQWDPIVAGRAYYAFDTRADALFIGCLLGLAATGGFLNDWRPVAKRLLSVLALASTAVTFWIIWNVGLAARSLPLYWLPISEVAAAVIITFFVIHPKSYSARLLSLPILVLLGNMSYAVYVIHWPVYVAVSPFGIRSLAGWPFWALETIRISIVMALAFASWFLIENRLMKWRKKRFASGGPEVAADPAVPSVRSP